MRQLPGGFLGMGNTLRSLAGPSVIDTALNLVRQQTRRYLAEGGAAPPMQKRAKADLVRDFVLPLDVDAAEMRKAIEAKLGDDSLRATEAPPILERKAGGRVAVSGYHVLRLGDGRFDLGRRFLHGLVKQVRDGR